MMWLYYISNVMVFNADQKERSDEKHFLKSLEKINDKLTIEDEAIDKPTLIIARRNFEPLSEKESIKEREFIHSVKELNLFDPNIITINFPYPGKRNVREKEILDVPLA